jgi:hypothetical protein
MGMLIDSSLWGGDGSESIVVKKEDNKFRVI